MKWQKKRTKSIVGGVLALILLLIAFLGAHYFCQTHFLENTKIENVDCSYLSIDEAVTKISKEKGENAISFIFSDGEEYVTHLRQFGISIDIYQIEQIFEKQHVNWREERDYNLISFISVDRALVEQFLRQIPELKEENMVDPENAYLTWNDTEFSIKKECLGSKINFDEAMELAIKKLENQDEQIDFSTITKIDPEIVEEDLIPKRDYLNSILGSSINFNLSNGNVVTLDSNTIKHWVYQDKNGEFVINTDQGIYDFVENLAVMVNEANSNMQFIAADSMEMVTVNVPQKVRAQLDKETEIAIIKDMLGNSEPINTMPIYDRELISEHMTSHVEIDISRQHVWMYKDGALIVDSPCVTGDVEAGHNTPTGVFYLTYKARNVYLKGFNDNGTRYSSFVQYWMPFNKGIGMHDASWRKQFGKEIYLTNGSHGCVNLPADKANIIYENIDDTMPIIVYES